MRFLTQDQIDNFWRDGVLVVEDAVCAEDLADLRLKPFSLLKKSN
jgi:hypothetical protein